MKIRDFSDLINGIIKNYTEYVLIRDEMLPDLWPSGIYVLGSDSGVVKELGRKQKLQKYQAKILVTVFQIGTDVKMINGAMILLDCDGMIYPFD